MVKVSVIVPNYNHSEFLKQRLDSVLNQTFQDFEVILLDDASTDASIDILNNYKDHPKVSHLIINDLNSGNTFKQWKKGIDLAIGEYIWIAESDDYCELDFLELMINELQNGTQICYSQSDDVDMHGKYISNRLEYTSEFDKNIWKKDFLIDGKEFIRNYMIFKNVIPNASAAIFKKELIDDNVFSKDLLNMGICGDWLFWLKICADSHICFISETLNKFRIHSGATRIYKDVSRRKQRLLEEVICRNYLEKKYHFSNSERNENLIRNWIYLHSKWAIFKKYFYRFKLHNCNGICLLLKFIKVKL